MKMVEEPHPSIRNGARILLWFRGGRCSGGDKVVRRRFVSFVAVAVVTMTFLGRRCAVFRPRIFTTTLLGTTLLGIVLRVRTALGGFPVKLGWSTLATFGALLAVLALLLLVLLPRVPFSRLGALGLCLFVLRLTRRLLQLPLARSTAIHVGRVRLSTGLLNAFLAALFLFWFTATVPAFASRSPLGLGQGGAVVVAMIIATATTIG